jgi:hypothetical protein
MKMTIIYKISIFISYFYPGQTTMHRLLRYFHTNDRINIKIHL